MGGDLSDLHSFSLETISRDYFEAGAAIREIMKSSETVMLGGMTVLGGVGALAISQKAYEVLIAIPFLVGGLLLYGLRRTAEMVALGAYRQALEDAIEDAVGFSVLSWERRIVPTFVRSAAVRGLWWFYLVALAGTSIGAYFAAAATHDHEHGLTYALLSCGLGFLLILLGASSWATWHTWTKASEAASGGLASLRAEWRASR